MPGRRLSALVAGIATIAATASAGSMMLATAGPASANQPVTGAAFTTVNEHVDGAGHCLNGDPAVNCNIYDGKQYVWLSGGPLAADVGAGNYFFAVLVPGGQADPNDGTPKNLSSPNDDYTNRTFSVDGSGAVSYSGSHPFDSNKIRLMPYNDTSNPGGVYIMAICSLANGYPVNPSSCKYDAFKVQVGTPPPGQPLTVTKDAAGSYTKTWTWGTTKSADKTIVKQIGGSATFTYTVNVTHDSGTPSNVNVAGMIKVFNPNVDSSNNTVDVSGADVSDQLSDGTVCAVTNGSNADLTAAQTQFSYSCNLSNPPEGQLDNTVTVTWPQQFLDNGATLDAGTAGFTFSDIAFAVNKVDDCAAVTDSSAGTLGNVCQSDSSPTTFTYSRTVAVPSGCVSYDNTATFTTNTLGTTGSASQTVTVCGPVKTGALTIGFWKTTNGQGLIKTYCSSPALGTFLAGLGGGSGPFSNAPTSCSSLVSYVAGILNGASATNMNNMAKAQMLGTALDVWFSGPGWTSTKAGSVKPPSTFLSHNSLGTFNMDTTAVCPMVDNLSTGTATCQNNTPSTDAVQAGAVPASPMSMQSILDYAATVPSPFNGSTSSSNWYGGNRTQEEILKNIFDQFNNQQAFGSF